MMKMRNRGIVLGICWILLFLQTLLAFSNHLSLSRRPSQCILTSLHDTTLSDTPPPPPPSTPPPPPTITFPMVSVILNNLQSGNNIGRICRNCLAFNVAQVIIIGKSDFKSKMHNGDKGANRRLYFKHCTTLEEARDHLKSQQAVILGVEITEQSKSIDSQPYHAHTAFMFGNEGSGLSPRQRGICDDMVYIPQYASGGMASINVACSSAIVLHSFATWASFKETQRIGEKFI